MPPSTAAELRASQVHLVGEMKSFADRIVVALWQRHGTDPLRKSNALAAGIMPEILPSNCGTEVERDKMTRMSGGGGVSSFTVTISRPQKLAQFRGTCSDVHLSDRSGERGDRSSFSTRWYSLW